MPLIIQPIQDKQIWNDLLQAVRPKSFLQGWNWGAFHQHTGHRVERFGVFDGSVCIGGAQVIIIKARRGHFLFCPHGPLVMDPARIQEVLSSLLPSLRELASVESCLCIRFSPLFLDTGAHRQLFSDLGFRPAPTHLHPELSWLLDIASSEDLLLQNMRKNTRYAIKKAEKDGVTIIESANPEDVEIFWKVYETTFKRQHFIPFSKNYLKTEFETFGQNDQARFFFGQYQGEIISAAMVMYDDVCGYYHHGASNQSHPKIPASHLVQWHAILEAKRRGCSFYNFWGVVPESQKSHPWAGLSLFKRGFGGFEEAYVHAQDLPLKSRYWLMAAVEYLRRWRRRL